MRGASREKKRKIDVRKKKNGKKKEKRLLDGEVVL